MTISLHDLLAAAESGAASVYHDVVASGCEITTWAEDPSLRPLIKMAVFRSNTLLQRADLSPGIVESDIYVALLAFAALDPTLLSGGGTSPRREADDR